MQDLIFVSMENWDDVWRRNQFLCAGLARRFPQNKILFVGLTRDFSNRLRGGESRFHGPTTWVVPDLPNITVTRPPKLLPNSLQWGRTFNDALFRLHVQRLARRLQLQAPLLWLNPHSAVHMVERMSERAVIYDITDDWISLTQSPRLTRLITVQDAELCRRAEAVIVCSQKLFDLKEPLARHLHLIPNGVDAAHYARVLDGTGPLPPQAMSWSKPVLGYTGTIHPDRVDVDLVVRVAQELKNCSIVLIGPNFMPSEDQARLDALPNVFLVGAVPYQQLTDYMRSFDICITPHRQTAFTESLNPIKLWEYLAAGKPIVSTNVAGFRDYPDLVSLASTPDEFIDACQSALSEEGVKPAARRAEAGKHSWDSRIDQVLAVMTEAVSTRSGGTRSASLSEH